MVRDNVIQISNLAKSLHYLAMAQIKLALLGRLTTGMLLSSLFATA